MKNKKYHTVGTVPQCNGKIVERGITDTPNTHKYMTAYFSGLVSALQYKVAGLNLLYWPTPPLLVKWYRHARRV